MANNILPAFRENPTDFFPEPKQERDNFSLVSDVLSMDIEEQRKFFSDERFGTEIGNPEFAKDFRNMQGTEQIKFLNDFKENSIMVATAFDRGEIPKDTPEFDKAQRIYLKVKPFIQPAAEIGALTVGGIVGAPVAPPFGSIGGAALSFGIVRNLFKMADSFMGIRDPQGFIREAQEAVADIEEGAAFEIGGQLLQPVLRGGKELIKKPFKALAKKSTLTQTGAAQRASDVIAREIKGTEITQPQIDENVRLAKEIQDKIRKTIDPEFKFTFGQLTDDGSTVALERTLARRDGVDLTQSQRQHAVESLRQYYNKKVLSTGTAEDFVQYTERMAGELSAATKEATKAVEAEVTRLNQHIEPQIFGTSIHKKLAKGKSILKDKAKDLYDKIPDLKLETGKLSDDIKTFVKAEDRIIEPRTKEMIKLINSKIGKKTQGAETVPRETAARQKSTLAEQEPIFIEPVSGEVRSFPEVKVKGAIKGEEVQITEEALNEAIRRGYKPNIMTWTDEPTFTAGIGDISWSGKHTSFLTTTKEGLIKRIFNIVEPKVVDVTGRTAFIEKLKRLSGEDLVRIVEKVSKSDFGAKNKFITMEKLWSEVGTVPRETNVLIKEATKAVEAEVTRLNQHIEPQIFGTSIKAEDRIIEPRIGKKTQESTGYQVLRKLHSRVGRNYRTANGGTNPNLEDARQLFKLQGLLDDAMKQIETKNPSAAKAYNEATKFYKEDFIPTFRQGTVADVLQRGTRGEETRIAKANIAQAFDSLDGIDDFLRAVGNNQAARSAMKDYYSLSLSNSAIDSEGTVVAKKASTWLSKNISKLKKLGIENEFKTLEARQRVVDQTIANIDVFNKSIAGRILEADVENVISNAYRSSKNLPQTTRELLALAKGNKAAEQGLKKAFAEFLTKESESNAPGFFQAIGGTSDADIKFLESMSKMNFLFKKFRSSIRIMYIDEPVKLQAIDDMWTAFRILERTAKSPIGAGSPTAELIFGSSAISRGAGIAIGSVRPGFFYPFKVVNSWISNYGLHNTEAFLTKAMFDPDYAAIMTKAASPNGLTKEGVSTLNRLMRNVLLSSTDFPNRISSTEKEKKR